MAYKLSGCDSMQEICLLGKGNTAEVFEYKDGKVCKLFFEGYPHEYVGLEFRNANEMYRNRISVSKPFQMVRIENREGIIYEKIEGKTLLNIITENKEDADIDAILDMFVHLHLDILAHHSKSVLSYKEYLIAILKNKKVTNQMVFDKVIALPDDDYLLHGDFHPDNILVKPDETPVVIDFMNVCHGPVLYDITRTYFLIKEYNVHLANRYLKKIGVLENDISKFLSIIEFCRKYEG